MTEETKETEKTCPFWMGKRAKCVLAEKYQDYERCGPKPCEVIYSAGVTGRGETSYVKKPDGTTTPVSTPS